MICKVCNQDKGDDFRKNRITAKVCRECDNAAQRERNKKNKEKPKPPFIVCKQCNKKTSDFVINNRVCQDCRRAYGRHYRRTTTKAKEWAENNRERMAYLQHRWYKNNRQKIIKKLLNRIKRDPDFNMARLHRQGARGYVTGAKKKSKYMNYRNYGILWTLDHVIPIYSFLKHEYLSEVILNWENIRPVHKRHNLVKNKYLNKEESIAHYNKLKEFLSTRDMECSKEYKKVMRKIRREHKEQLCNQESEDEEVDEDQGSNIDDLDLDEYFEQLDDLEDLTVESTPSVPSESTPETDEDVPYD